MTSTGPSLPGQREPGRTRVVVIDDHATLTELLKLALEDQADLEYLGHAASAEAGLRLVHEVRPDVVVVDQGLPGMDGVEATARILRGRPGTRVVMLTAAPSPELMERAAAAGTSAFVAKTGALEDLLDAIRYSPMVGTMTVAPGAHDEVERVQLEQTPSPDAPELTPREREVLDLLGIGLDPASIAKRLGVSVHTVRGHLKTLMAKLNSHSQVQAVVNATRLGLLRDPQGF